MQWPQSYSSTEISVPEFEGVLLAEERCTGRVEEDRGRNLLGTALFGHLPGGIAVFGFVLTAFIQFLASLAFIIEGGAVSVGLV